MGRWSFIVLSAGCGFSVTAPEPALDPEIDASVGTRVPTTIDLVASSDTFLRAQDPNDVYGRDYYQRCGSGNPGYLTNRAIYRFDLSALASCVIAKAELRAYYFDQDYNRDPTLSAYRVVADWSESQATWNERMYGLAWASAGGDFDATPLASVVARSGHYGWLGWDITATAVAWYAGQPNYGVIVVEPNDLGGAFEGRKFFYASEARANRPHLRVTCE